MIVNMSNYKKYANEILSDVETYKLVLDGKLSRFPVYFWTKPYSLESSALITRFLFEEKLKLKLEDLPKVVNTKLFKTHKLGGMLSQVFSDSIYYALENAYKEKINACEFRAPRNYWENTNNVKKAIKWLIEDKLSCKSKSDILERYNYNALEKNGLARITGLYNLYESLELAYPGMFEPWELNKSPWGYWDNKDNTDNIKRAIKWLIEDKLECKSREDIVNKYNSKALIDNGFGTLTSSYSLYDIINMVYPNRFKPWELNSSPRRFWEDDRNIAIAIKWLIEEKLHLKNKDDILKTINQKTFEEHGLHNLKNRKSMYEIMNIAYPNKFSREDFKVGR